MNSDIPRRYSLGIFTLLLLLMAFVVSSMGSQVSADAESAKDNTLTRTMEAFLGDRLETSASVELEAASNIACVGGIVSSGGQNYPCDNIDLAAFMPFADLGGGTSEANDIWGWTSGNREFAIMGRVNGTVFVEITNPMSPVYLGNLPTQTANSNWRDIKVHADHAFIVSEAGNHGMQVFDLTQLLSVGAPQTFSNTAFYNGFGSCHNIVINEDSGFAYGVGCAAGSQSACSGGLHAVDVNAPTAPAFAGCFSTDGYTHDAECVRYNGPDLDYIGREICVNSNEDTVTIVDMTNKAAPVQLSRTPYGGSAYTHQNWFTEDQRTVLMNDELDESNNGHNTRTRIFDVSDLNAPTLVGFQDSTEAAIDHNLYTKGHSAYLSNYRAGLRVYDTTNAMGGAMPEIGFFDVYPASNSAAFNGTWSNFMYYDSDVIVASHIENGLYILDPNAALRQEAQDYTMRPDEVVLDVCSSASTTFRLDSVFGFDANVTLVASGAVDNVGTATALPAGLTAAFSVNPVAVAADTTPGVPTGETSVLTITDTGAVPGTYLILVTATGTDANGATITHSEYLRIETCPQALLAATKAVNPTGTVLVGSTIEYTIDVSNIGNLDASTTTDDTLPAGLDNVSCNLVFDGLSTTETLLGTVTFDCPSVEIISNGVGPGQGGRPGGGPGCTGTYAGVDGQMSNVDFNGLEWTPIGGVTWTSETEAFIDCPAGGMADYSGNPWGAPTNNNGGASFQTGSVPNPGCSGESPLGSWFVNFNDSYGDNFPTGEQTLTTPITLEVYGFEFLSTSTPIALTGNVLNDIQDLAGAESAMYVCTGTVSDSLCDGSASTTLNNQASASAAGAINSPVFTNEVSTTVDLANSPACNPLAVEFAGSDAGTVAPTTTPIFAAVAVMLGLMLTAVVLRRRA